MALPDKMTIHLPDLAGTYTAKPIIFRDSVTYGPDANRAKLNQGTSGVDYVVVQIDIVGLVEAAARASAKVDLGVNRAQRYSAMASLRFAVAPTNGNVVEFFWAASASSVAAEGNPGPLTGVDQDVPGYTGGTHTNDDIVRQMDYIGSFVVVNTTDVQVAFVGMFIPPTRYGMLVILNRSGQTIAADATDDEDVGIRLEPMIDEVIE